MGQKQESTATWHGLFKRWPSTDGVMRTTPGRGNGPDPGAGIVDLKLNGKGYKDHTVQTGEICDGGGRRPRCRGSSAPCSLSRPRPKQGDRQASLKEIQASFEVSPGPIVEFTALNSQELYCVFVRACNTTDQCSSANLPFLVSAPKNDNPSHHDKHSIPLATLTLCAGREHVFLSIRNTWRRQQQAAQRHLHHGGRPCYQAISAYGSEISKLAPTPNIDRIAKNGKNGPGLLH